MMETCIILFIPTLPAMFSLEIRPRADLLGSQFISGCWHSTETLRLGLHFLKGRDHSVNGGGYISQCKMF